MVAPEDTLPLVVEPETLSDHLGDSNLLILDAGKAETYAQGHVPGAVHVPPSALIQGQQPAPGELPSAAWLSQLFARLGLTEERHVVAYDDEGGGWAGRLLWTLDVLGHSRWSYLDGGIHAWRQTGLEVETETHYPSPSEYQASLHEGPLANKNRILDRLGATDLVIWDARSPEEFQGLKKQAQKSGHIPGAVNGEWTEFMDRERGLRLKPKAELRERLAELGISEDKEIITHCQSHHRSGLTYLIGRYLGFSRIKAYPGSWAEWGNDPDTPVETDEGV